MRNSTSGTGGFAAARERAVLRRLIAFGLVLPAALGFAAQARALQAGAGATPGRSPAVMLAASADTEREAAKGPPRRGAIGQFAA
jgi:hypothetical protein